MGLAEILLGIALPLLLGIGATLAVSDANAIEFWVARGCFMLAALDAVFFTVKWLWLGEPLDARKIVVGALIAAATLICLVYSLRWVDYREERIITVLLPGSKPMPEMPEGCELSPNDLAVFFGKSVALTQNFPFTILNISGTEMLAIEAVPDKPQININILRIFDDLWNIIARIDSGGFLGGAQCAPSKAKSEHPYRL